MTQREAAIKELSNNSDPLQQILACVWLLNQAISIWQLNKISVVHLTNPEAAKIIGDAVFGKST